MPRYDFLDLARDVLAAAPEPMTFEEIWVQAEGMGIRARVKTKGKTPEATLGARLYMLVKTPDSDIVKIGRNPARFFLKARQSELGDKPDDTSVRPPAPAPPLVVPVVVTPSAGGKREPYHERDLHPVVTWFAFNNTHFHRGRPVYTKTIYHERSKNAGPSEWLYPDLVGFYSPVAAWNNTLFDLSEVMHKAAIRLYSFELKKVINRGNYRESFFQAVSNSSWSHEGYLVTADIQTDDELEAELERLSSSFGIGVIELNLQDINASRVIYPARPREALDWEMMNKLSRQNPNFQAFIEDVLRSYTIKKIHQTDYDRIEPDIEAYIQRLLKKENASA